MFNTVIIAVKYIFSKTILVQLIILIILFLKREHKSDFKPNFFKYCMDKACISRKVFTLVRQEAQKDCLWGNEGVLSWKETRENCMTSCTLRGLSGLHFASRFYSHCAYWRPRESLFIKSLYDTCNTCVVVFREPN